MISLLSDDTDFYSSRITRVKIVPPEWKLSGNGMFFMGSCFAENLYGEYSSANLRAETSPFGNIYNPASLAKAAGMLSGSLPEILPEDCFFHQGLYRHFMFDTHRTVETSASELAKKLNSRINSAGEFIKKSEAAVITLGTAFVFEESEAGIVNNCHKLPADDFRRNKLEPEEAAGYLSNTVNELKKLNPAIKIILTVSPVRHLRDNAAENSLSKAILRCAVDRVCRPGTENSLWYFPSFELLLDELRDYRWYASDLTHPSGEAVEYIISRFINSIYNDEYKTFLKKWLKTVRAAEHRPHNPGSESYRKFYRNNTEQRNNLAAAHPEFIMVDSESKEESGS